VKARSGLSRRRMLAGGLSLAGTAALAACDAGAQQAPSSGTPAPAAAATTSATVTPASTAAPAAAAASGGTPTQAGSPADGTPTTAVGLAPAPAVAFYGPHQAGIATPAQDRLVFASLDFKGTSATDLRELLKTWTAASAAMAQGQPVPGVVDNDLAPPPDTGEASGLGPANLSITFGFGPSLFDDRLGLTARRPAALIDISKLPGDRLVPALTGGDLCIQACADDPQVAFHAVRNLARLGRGVAAVRWMQLGFGRTSTTSTQQATPRNLMGFKDGTNNLKAEDPTLLDTHIWVGDEATQDQPWMRGGTYLVARRIRMRIESWDRVSLDEQERVIGRHKTTGAPLTGAHEFDTVDLQARTPASQPVIDVKAHIRLAAPDTNGGVHLLRRGYSFTDGIDPATGELDAGLFFIAFQRDPRTGFVAVQRRLAATDSLNDYIRHTGSAIFACPPGVDTGDFIGSSLLGISAA
jgi:deferrochelatase/peroxidase EfeB